MRTDRNQLLFNQTLIVVGVLLSLLTGRAEGVYLLAALMASQHLGLDFMVALKRGLRIPARPVDEDPRPHRFARSVGAAFLIAAALAFSLGAPLVGWGLALVVALLAFINLAFGFCLGCFMYYQFRLLRHRLGLN
ncbi:DUF4395 domain-containing protein [Marinithermus hydrothermalis]|uniref:DUF4395 domain-containing protein n=1 Tax=Marinithermus hydrothermalis (strain DSM 14884 / JCM 11576 / T1) TaxID=869210 RepID=F2NPR4_MARHT|nr:DUF4395 domain-containing protein [Marinithermus hydrothermalis]AEB12840.1 hypothetical protein Marky_2116 [Marinithermus hydrothermalis DSM 14884]